MHVPGTITAARKKGREEEEEAKGTYICLWRKSVNKVPPYPFPPPSSHSNPLKTVPHHLPLDPVQPGTAI